MKEVPKVWFPRCYTWRGFSDTSGRTDIHGGCFSGDGSAADADFLSVLFLLLHNRWTSILLLFTYHFIRDRDPEPLSLVIMDFLLKYTTPVILVAITMGLPEKRPAGFTILINSRVLAVSCENRAKILSKIRSECETEQQQIQRIQLFESDKNVLSQSFWKKKKEKVKPPLIHPISAVTL